MAKSGQAVFVSTILKEQESCILVNALIVRSQCDILLKIKESLVRVSFYLQAFSSFKVRLCILFVEIYGNGKILNSLGEVSKAGENQSAEEEIFGNVILALLYGLINIVHGLVELVFIEMQNRPVKVECRYVVVGQLRQVSDPNGNAFDRCVCDGNSFG